MFLSGMGRWVELNCGSIDVIMNQRVFIGSVWRQIAATVQAFITLDIAALEGTVAAIPSRDLSRVCVCVHSASAI